MRFPESRPGVQARAERYDGTHRDNFLIDDMPSQQCFLNRHILHGERSALLKSACQVNPHPVMLHPTVPGRFAEVPKDSRDRTGMPPPETEPIQRIENSTSFFPMDPFSI